MKHPLALLLTDTHLDLYSLEIVKQAFEESLKICLNQKIPYLFHLGDFFDVRKSLTFEELKASQEIFKRLDEDSLVSKHFIAGNHDRSVEGKESYLHLYKDFFRNINFYEEVEKIEINDFSIYLFPNKNKYIDEELIKLEALLIKDTNKKKVLLLHHQLQEIPVNIQVKFSLILMGHIHDKEEITKKAIYIGSVYQKNFSEDSDKGFTILYDDLTLKRIKFDSKEYVTQNVDMNFFNEKEVIDFIKNFQTKNKNKFLRIVLKGQNKDISFVQTFCKQNDIDCVSDITTVLSGSEQLENISELTKGQINEYFEEFIIEGDVPEEISNILKNYLNK